MKKPNITPGPWHVGESFTSEPCIRANDEAIAVCCELLEDEAKANARLIAAAPQMADALNDLAASFETLWRITCKNLPNDTLEAAKAALLAAGYTE